MPMNPRLMRPLEGTPSGTPADLLLHFDGTNGSTSFVDSSANALTVTANGDAQISTAQSKFGGSSGYFDGDGDYLRVNHTFDWDGDFTLEMWIYRNSMGGYYPTIFEAGDISGSSMGLHLYISGDLLACSDALSVTLMGPTINDGQWYHIAVVRDGGVNKLFVDGVLVASQTFNFLVANDVISIGSAPNYAMPFDGYIDDLRLVPLAVYAGDFTPPAAPLAALATAPPPPPMPTDADAIAYVLAVNAADGQPLEKAAVDAIDAFVIGCKADGNWSAIKASCILSGARTLAGALTPLTGTAPTSYNFVSGDYSRATGLAGDGSTKYLDTNRAGDADPQDNFHLAAMITATGAGSMLANIGGVGGNPGLSNLASGSSVATNFRNHTASNAVVSGLPALTSYFAGSSRSNGTGVTGRRGGVSYSSTQTSAAPNALNILAYKTHGTAHATHRMSFYSIGENVDLTALESRVLTLMTAFASL